MIKIPSKIPIYQMSKRRSATERPKRPVDKLPPDEVPVLTPIQGRQPGSSQEWFYAKALDIARIRYKYQYTVMAPAGIAGSQRIDFLCLVPPKPIPVLMQGFYWHYGSAEKEAETKFKIEQLMQQYRSQFGYPIEVDARRINSISDALLIIRSTPRLIA